MVQTFSVSGSDDSFQRAASVNPVIYFKMFTIITTLSRDETRCVVVYAPRQITVVIVQHVLATHGCSAGGVVVVVVRRRYYVRWRLDEDEGPAFSHHESQPFHALLPSFLA